MGILDLDIRVALVVEPDDIATIVEDVHPAQQRLAQSRMRDRGSVMPERAALVETEANRPHLLQLLGRELHHGSLALGAAED